MGFPLLHYSQNCDIKKYWFDTFLGSLPAILPRLILVHTYTELMASFVLARSNKNVFEPIANLFK